MKRIAMWSGPRNISTAMMRSFENRADTCVVDEPFYACYLKRSGSIHPARDMILDQQSSNYSSIVESLISSPREDSPIFYQKHMCHHMLADMDRRWLDKVNNAFLIRDPRKMIASYVKSRQDPVFADLGALQQDELFKRTADKIGAPPPVVESADILKDPEGTLNKLCNSLAIPFDPAMLSWPAGKRESDGVWAPYWYASVEKSTGFVPYKESKVELTPALERLADKCMPMYENLKKYKI